MLELNGVIQELDRVLANDPNGWDLKLARKQLQDEEVQRAKYEP
jgi:hypothetical protein